MQILKRSTGGKDIAGNHRAIRRLQTQCERSKRTVSRSTQAAIEIACGLGASQRCPPSRRRSTVTGELLHRCVKDMKKKAPGGDDWDPRQLLRQPGQWFDRFATLWRSVKASGRVPKV